MNADIKYDVWGVFEVFEVFEVFSSEFPRLDIQLG
jgi:hypothetical protein